MDKTGHLPGPRTEDAMPCPRCSARQMEKVEGGRTCQNCGRTFVDGWLRWYRWY